MSAQPDVITKPSLTIKRRLNAPPAKVYAAWTEPEKIARWFGPHEIGSVQAAMDVRVGGRFNFIMNAADGQTHNVSGTYREVVPNQKLVFDWAWISTPERVSLVTITLKPDGEGTILTLTHEQFFDEAAREGHSHGWTGALAKLETYLAEKH